jgi:phospholipid-binding lipoprotein MlaA
MAVASALQVRQAMAEPPSFLLDHPEAVAGAGMFMAPLGLPDYPLPAATDQPHFWQTVQEAGEKSDRSPDSSSRTSLEKEEEFVEEYDPWESFNAKIFAFNRQVDRHVLKPVATVWNAVVPEPLQESLGHAFDNLGMPRRLLNNLFQLKLKGAGRELARFLINSTVGFAGFLDVARDFGLEKSNEDTGQTFGVYGVGPGPYLVLPLLPPLTLRDGVGTAIDAVMDPLNYLLPFGANVGRKAGSTVNERALSLEVFEGIEEDVFDLYTAVRSAYLQRRQRAVEE